MSGYPGVGRLSRPCCAMRPRGERYHIPRPIAAGCVITLSVVITTILAGKRAVGPYIALKEKRQDLAGSRHQKLYPVIGEDRAAKIATAQQPGSEGQVARNRRSLLLNL